MVKETLDTIFSMSNAQGRLASASFPASYGFFATNLVASSLSANLILSLLSSALGLLPVPRQNF